MLPRLEADFHWKFIKIKYIVRQQPALSGMEQTRTTSSKLVELELVLDLFNDLSAATAMRIT